MKPTSGHETAHRSGRGYRSGVLLLALAVLFLGIVADRSVRARTTQSDSSPSDSLPLSQGIDPFNQDNAPPDYPDSPLQSSQEDEPGIEIEILEEINPDSVGILESHQGGLGENMWAGTSRGRANALVNMVPVTSASPFVRDLVRRILLSNAAAPQGDHDDQSLVARRIDLLYAMGDIEAMQALMTVAPKDHLGREQIRAHIDHLLLGGNHLDACRELERGADSYRGLYWRQLRVFCDLLAQKHDKARLGLELLRDAQYDTPDDPQVSDSHNFQDQNFQNLVEYILDNTEYQTTDNQENAPPTLLDPTPLSFALARIGRIDLSSLLAETSDPAILLAIASNPQFPLIKRIKAGGKAEKLGLLPTQSLRKLYENVVFSNATIARISQNIDHGTPLETGTSEQGTPRDPAEIRALLLQAAAAQPVTLSLARARLLSALYQQAHQDGVYGSIARVSVPILLEITPESHLIWFSAEAIRALLTARKIEAALSWYTMIEQNAASNPQAATISQKVWPLIQIADSNDHVPWSDHILESWITGQQVTGQQVTQPDAQSTDPSEAQETGDGETRQTVSLVLALLVGLGEPVTGDHWAFAWNGLSSSRNETMPNRTPSQAGLINALRQSSQSLRVAETILLALAALGDQAPGATDPLILQEVVEALRYIGFDEEARSLALEAVLDGNI